MDSRLRGNDKLGIERLTDTQFRFVRVLRKYYAKTLPTTFARNAFATPAVLLHDLLRQRAGFAEMRRMGKVL